MLMTNEAAIIIAVIAGFFIMGYIGLVIFAHWWNKYSMDPSKDK